jgi:hypothetical protein
VSVLGVIELTAIWGGTRDMSQEKEKAKEKKKQEPKPEPPPRPEPKVIRIVEGEKKAQRLIPSP